ncbi:choline uptake/conversion transcriptional regulator CudC [Peribacillus frigoritolerans]|uniref:choline uptake/conversion transcriptional regulator CudC n=1 Tax=Peribacillus frigoritolerans TaxID=450367 RepID=UPI002B05683A|nr:GbsR/MarR family transcriptional regulator [Peribacillus frigoritolerans]MEA3577778.1 GbsR/MarR family transcriptional regulator [Peribacillus frigoritolerans]
MVERACVYMEEQKDHIEILEEAESLVIDAIAETMDLYGVTHSIGRLYGVLYFSEEPMTLNQMSKSLGMSKPSMSTGIHSLVDIEMVQKVWRKGERKDLYKAEKDFFVSFLSFFCKKWERELSVNMQAIEKATEKLNSLLDNPDVPDAIQQKARKDLQQLQDSTQYYLWLKKLVHAFRSKELFKMIEEIDCD